MREGGHRLLNRPEDFKEKGAVGAVKDAVADALGLQIPVDQLLYCLHGVSCGLLVENGCLKGWFLNDRVITVFFC